MVNCMQSHETIMMVGRAETSHCIGIDGISGSAAWLQGLCIPGPDSSVCTRQALVPWNNIPHCTLHSSTWLPCVFHSAIVTPLVPSLLHRESCADPSQPASIYIHRPEKSTMPHTLKEVSPWRLR